MNKTDIFFLNNISDLAEVQRSSFFRFLLKGITNELQTIENPGCSFGIFLKFKKEISTEKSKKEIGL